MAKTFTGVVTQFGNALCVMQLDGKDKTLATFTNRTKSEVSLDRMQRGSRARVTLAPESNGTEIRVVKRILEIDPPAPLRTWAFERLRRLAHAAASAPLPR